MYKELLKIFLALVIMYNLKLYQINIKAVYLINKLNKKDKTIYIKIFNNVII